MVAVAHTGVLTKPQSDLKLFQIDWSDFLTLSVSRRVPVVDKIADSTWAISSDSPTATVTLADSGFDDVSGITWVTVDGGTDGDTVYIENTITTGGGCVNGKMTPAQRATRQIRMRVSDVGASLVGGGRTC